MKTASLSAVAPFLLPAHSIAQSWPSAKVITGSERALQDEALMSVTMDGVEYMGRDGSHSGKSGKVVRGKSGKADAPHLPSVFNQTDKMGEVNAYRVFLLNPDQDFPNGEKFDLFVIDPDGEAMGSHRGFSYFYPPFTEGNFIGSSVITVMGETVTIVGNNDIVAATEGYSEYVGGKAYISTVQFQPFYLGTVTLALPGTPAPPTPAPVTPAPTPAPTPVPKAFESLPELSTAVREYMAQGCGMSAGCEVGLTYGYPMNTWDVSMVTSFFGLFLGMDSFNEDISDWNTSAVTNMLNCFQRNNAFNGDLSKWDVSKNIDFRSTFSAASSFNSDISMWNMSSARFFSGMFNSAKLFNIDISGWDMSSTLDAASMFDHAESFNQDIGGWNTAGMTATRAMFFHATEFNQDISSWDVTNVHDIAYMFEGATKFNQNLCAWDSTFPYNEPFFNIFNDSGCEHTEDPEEGSQGPFCTACGDRRVLRKNSAVEQEMTSLSQKHAQAAAAPHRSLQAECFENKAELETAIASYFDEDCPDNISCETGVQYGWPMNAWCVGSVDNMQSLFEGMRTFNEDISAWDVSSVTTTRRMFHNARAFNGNLSSWNMSSNTDMWEMFYNAMAFEGGDLTGWDVSNVRLMYHCFWYARAFNGDISTWNISNLKNGAPSTGLNGVFFSAPEFNADLSGWDLTGVNQLLFTFFHNSKFNSDISGWNVAASDYNRGMFYRATSFNQDLSSWRTTDSYDNLYMFHGASSFNQDLCAWGTAEDYVYPGSFYMFRDTACEETASPEKDNVGPFCAICSE